MDYFDYDNKIEPKKGRLLVSEPFLPDPNFERTVVLLCEHNTEGSFGFILNKPSLVLVSEVMEELSTVDSRLFIGGPVQHDSFHYIHKNETLTDAVKIRDGIYWGGNFEQLKLLVETGQAHPEDYKYFVGYSGWSPGQLEEELEAGSWIVVEDISPSLVFHSDINDMWKKALKTLGGRFNIYSNYPIDPRLN